MQKVLARPIHRPHQITATLVIYVHPNFEFVSKKKKQNEFERKSYHTKNQQQENLKEDKPKTKKLVKRNSRFYI